MKMLPLSRRLTAALLCSTSLCAASAAMAQSIPLNIIQEEFQLTPTSPIGYEYRLGIDVGINGGTPEEYLFDTGSDSFNIDIGNSATGPAWFPVNNVGNTPVADLTPYMYGNGTYGYLLYQTTVSSVQFYNSQTNSQVYSFSGGSTGIPVNAAPYYIGTDAGSGPGLNGDQPGILINNPTLTSYGYTTEPYYQDLTWQQAIDAGQPPEEGNFFGTFGAGDFVYPGDTGGVPAMMSSSGYIVEANGQADNMPGGCGPACMIVGLTPSLRAQFFSVNHWFAGSQGTFAISGAHSSQEFDTLFTYTLSNGSTSASTTLATLIDSGTPTIVLTANDIYTAAEIDGMINANADSNQNPNANSVGDVFGGLTLTAQGAGTGTQPYTVTTSGDYSGDASNSVTIDPVPTVPAGQTANAIEGISFFFNNAVMFDLENEATGYTPFYVTNALITTPITVTADMGPVGFANVISGTGDFSVGTGGITYLTAANTYSGATNIAQNAWLGVGGPGSIGNSSSVNDNGVFDIINANSAQVVQSLAGSGEVILGGNTLTLVNASGTFSGVIKNFYSRSEVNGNQPYPVTFGDETSGTYGGLIIANGVETLSGNNIYSGETGISQYGGLILTGMLVNSNVANAGYFLNNGIVGGATVSTGNLTGSGYFNNGLQVEAGTVAPSTSPTQPATMSVGNELILGSKANYEVITSGTQSSDIAVTGTAQINNATLTADADADTQVPQLGQSYTVLTATQGISGQFGTLSSNLSGPYATFPFLTTGLSYTPDTVTLGIIRSSTPFAAAAQTPDELATAGALDQVSPYLSVTMPITELNFQEAAGALRGLSGEVNATAETALIQDADVLRSGIINRLRMTEAAPGASATGIQAAPLGKASSHDRTIWMDGYGTWGNNSANADLNGMTNHNAGFMVGVDQRFGPFWHVGGMFAYGQSNFSLKGYPATGRSNNATIGGYAGRSWGKINLRLGATYTWNALTTGRSVLYPGFHDHLNGKSTDGTTQGFADVGYRVERRHLAAEPFVDFAYVNQSMSSFDENGGAASLHISDDDAGIAYTSAGIRLATAFVYRGVKLVPEASIAYRHAFGTLTPKAQESFLFGSPIFTVEGIPLARDEAVVSAGMSTAINRRVSVSLSYAGQYGNHFTQSGAEGAIKVSF